MLLAVWKRVYSARVPYTSSLLLLLLKNSTEDECLMSNTLPAGLFRPSRYGYTFASFHSVGFDEHSSHVIKKFELFNCPNI